MFSLSLIAVSIFILLILLVSLFGGKTLVTSAKDAGSGNIVRSVVLVVAAITIAITLFIKLVIL